MNLATQVLLSFVLIVAILGCLGLAVWSVTSVSTKVDKTDKFASILVGLLALGGVIACIVFMYWIWNPKESFETLPVSVQPPQQTNLAGDSMTHEKKEDEALIRQYTNGPKILLPVDTTHYANALQNGPNLGIATVKQNNKLPNYDVRAAPFIPKQNTSFYNSEYDNPVGYGQRPLL